MTHVSLARAALALLAGLLVSTCSGSSTTSPSTTTTGTAIGSESTGGGTLPAMFSRFGGSATVAIDGSTVVIRTTDIPDHPSPYFGAGNASYEAPHAGMQVNPHRIAAQALVFRIPATPAASGASDTPMGPIGVAVNGVVFFNQYAAGRSPLTSEIFSFDRFNGHPSPGNQYHYHVEPLWLTQSRGSSALMGVLLDGFPVYGTSHEDGSVPGDLDSCNGHTTPTPDHATGIYHYHVVSAPPYIAGCFHGLPGTVA